MSVMSHYIIELYSPQNTHVLLYTDLNEKTYLIYGRCSEKVKGEGAMYTWHCQNSALPSCPPFLSVISPFHTRNTPCISDMYHTHLPCAMLCTTMPYRLYSTTFTSSTAYTRLDISNFIPSDALLFLTHSSPI